MYHRMELNDEELLTVPNENRDREECEEEGTKEKKPTQSLSNILWRGLNLFMACFFALAAYVQLNDPDPIVWMVPYEITIQVTLFVFPVPFVYSVPACLCIAVAFSPDMQDHIVWQSLATADIASSLAGAIYLATTIRPHMQKDSIKNPLVLEEGREMSGLVIVIIWISLCKLVTCYTQRKGKVPAFFWIAILVLCLIPFSLWAYCYRHLDRNILPQHCKDML